MYITCVLGRHRQKSEPEILLLPNTPHCWTRWTWGETSEESSLCQDTPWCIHETAEPQWLWRIFAVNWSEGNHEVMISALSTLHCEVTHGLPLFGRQLHMKGNALEPLPCLFKLRIYYVKCTSFFCLIFSSSESNMQGCRQSTFNSTGKKITAKKGV